MSEEIPTKDLPVIIKKEWCKGCRICVAFCPTGVLEMINAKATVVNPDKCTFCKLCEVRCPDFAVKVDMSKKKEKK
jgi:2-oxoglutarate ferredoxin oxidoreductase subunit delta